MEDAVLSFLSDAGRPADDTRAAPASTGDAARPRIGSEQTLALILACLDDTKAEDVVRIDLRGKSEMGDYMVVASGRSTRQVSAMAERLVTELKTEGGVPCKVEGKGAGDWVLIDTGDVIVHLFRPEVREFYQLEKMWIGPEIVGGTAS
ncbi:MAG: ribosome silencing factor [Shimia sp.]